MGALGARKVRALATALELSEPLTQQALDVFAIMGASWANWAVGDVPGWHTDISDDGTPFEFSASFDGVAPRLRMLVESQAEPMSRTSSWSAGLALGERLRSAGLADLSLFDQIRDLFIPHEGTQGRFSLWHASVVEDGKPALFKAYVNPCLLGAGSAPYVVEQALLRLGFKEAWRFLKDRLASDTNAQIRYLSVDLEASEHARVKVYLGCSQSAVAVDRLIGEAGNSEPGDAQEWLATLTASQGPFDARPILNCFSFRREGVTPDVTVHVPIRCYVKHDAEALARVSNLLTTKDTQLLSRALSAVSERPLNVGRGLLTYASLRREAAAVRVTVYLSPEAYAISSRRATDPPLSDWADQVHEPLALSAPWQAGSALRALISRQEMLFSLQPFFAHLAAPGTVRQAELLSAYLAALHLYAVDLLYFAQEHAVDLRIRRCFAELAQACRGRAHSFQSSMGKLGIGNTAYMPTSTEQDLLREVAYARVADVISAKDDSVRLLVVTAVSSATDLILSKGLQFVTCSMNGEAPAGSADEHGTNAALISTVASLGLPESVDLETPIDRSFEAMFRVAAAITRAVFGA